QQVLVELGFIHRLKLRSPHDLSKNLSFSHSSRDLKHPVPHWPVGFLPAGPFSTSNTNWRYHHEQRETQRKKPPLHLVATNGEVRPPWGDVVTAGLTATDRQMVTVAVILDERAGGIQH